MEPSSLGVGRGSGGVEDDAPAWAMDREEDRKGLRMALGFGLLIHASLLFVRMADNRPLVPPPVDAIIYPTTNIAIREPEPPPPVEVRAPRQSRVARVPVPAELAPPEPLTVVEIEPSPIVVPEAPAVGLAAIPETLPPATGPVRFSTDMRRPVRIAGHEPTYTEAARRVRERGIVILDAIIDKNGRVTDIEVLKRLRFGLTESAVAAVSRWRFEPATLDGKPIAVRYTLTVRFDVQ